jgi:hypothetical protein
MFLQIVNNDNFKLMVPYALKKPELHNTGEMQHF